MSAIYVGRFKGDFSSILKVNYPDTESAIKYFDGEDEINKGKRKYHDWGYVEENTQFSQIYDFVPSECYDISKLTGLDNTAIALFKQPVGQTNPWHYDTNSYLVNKFGIKDKTKIYRYLVFLEDWDIGQLLQVGDDVLTHWKQGDCYTWEYGTYHLSTNAGRKTKYTMQITGVETLESLHKKYVKRPKNRKVWRF